MDETIQIDDETINDNGRPFARAMGVCDRCGVGDGSRRAGLCFRCRNGYTDGVA